jgi:hypothetical protein
MDETVSFSFERGKPFSACLRQFHMNGVLMYSTIRIGAAYLEHHQRNTACCAPDQGVFQSLDFRRCRDHASVKECFKILKQENEKLVRASRDRNVSESNFQVRARP